MDSYGKERLLEQSDPPIVEGMSEAQLENLND
jgi:hypothetical protein